MKRLKLENQLHEFARFSKKTKEHSDAAVESLVESAKEKLLKEFQEKLHSPEFTEEKLLQIQSHLTKSPVEPVMSKPEEPEITNAPVGEGLSSIHGRLGKHDPGAMNWVMDPAKKLDIELLGTDPTFQSKDIKGVNPVFSMGPSGILAVKRQKSAAEGGDTIFFVKVPNEGTAFKILGEETIGEVATTPLWVGDESLFAVNERGGVHYFRVNPFTGIPEKKSHLVLPGWAVSNGNLSWGSNGILAVPSSGSIHLVKVDPVTFKLTLTGSYPIIRSVQDVSWNSDGQFFLSTPEGILDWVEVDKKTGTPKLLDRILLSDAWKKFQTKKRFSIPTFNDVAVNSQGLVAVNTSEGDLFILKADPVTKKLEVVFSEASGISTYHRPAWSENGLLAMGGHTKSHTRGNVLIYDTNNHSDIKRFHVVAGTSTPDVLWGPGNILLAYVRGRNVPAKEDLEDLYLFRHDSQRKQVEKVGYQKTPIRFINEMIWGPNGKLIASDTYRNALSVFQLKERPAPLNWRERISNWWKQFFN